MITVIGAHMAGMFESWLTICAGALIGVLCGLLIGHIAAYIYSNKQKTKYESQNNIIDKEEQ